MEEEIKDLLAESDFESKFVNQWVEEIVDTAQKKLKDMKKPKLVFLFCYFLFCITQFRIIIVFFFLFFLFGCCFLFDLLF